jgi:hypothetical protein
MSKTVIFFYISSKQLPIRNHHLGFFNLLLPINILFYLHLSQNGDFIVITSKFIFKNNYYLDFGSIKVLPLFDVWTREGGKTYFSRGTPAQIGCGELKHFQ